jgi:hypothetical protein
MAARKSTSATILHKTKPKVRRPGVHAKTKHSKLKQSKLYKKRYQGQGK